MSRRYTAPYSKSSSLDYFEFDWRVRRYNPDKPVANGGAVVSSAAAGSPAVEKASGTKSPKARRKFAA